MKPTKTHRYPLIALLLLLAAAVAFFVISRAGATSPDLPAGCQSTRFPAVCAASYAKCNTIGLDDACMAVAQLDGQLGYDAVNGRQIPMSQNK